MEVDRWPKVLLEVLASALSVAIVAVAVALTVSESKRETEPMQTFGDGVEALSPCLPAPHEGGCSLCSGLDNGESPYGAVAGCPGKSL